MEASRVVEKQSAARAAVAEVRDGMVVGLGTGSTVAFAIHALAERCGAGLVVRAVATSVASEALARELGIDVIDFAGLTSVDLCIDGIDEIDPGFRAIKGAGGAMLREKIVAQAAVRMIAIGDSGKAVAQLGRAPVPVETLPFALGFVRNAVERLGATVKLRKRWDGEPYQTDQGNNVLDCSFGLIDEPEQLAARLSQVPGIMGHGIFLDEIDVLYIGEGEQVRRLERAVTSGRR